MGLRFHFKRDSAGGLMLVSYQPTHCPTWHWSIRIGKSPYYNRRRWLVCRASERFLQWHDYYRLPFGKALCISRQDYHRRSL